MGKGTRIGFLRGLVLLTTASYSRLFPFTTAAFLEPERVQLTSVKPGSTLALICTIIRPDDLAHPDVDSAAAGGGSLDNGRDTDFMNYVWRRELGTTRREEIFLGNLRQTSERWTGSKYDLVAAEGIYNLIVRDITFDDAGSYRWVWDTDWRWEVEELRKKMIDRQIDK